MAPAMRVQRVCLASREIHISKVLAKVATSYASRRGTLQSRPSVVEVPTKKKMGKRKCRRCRGIPILAAKLSADHEVEQPPPTERASAASPSAAVLPSGPHEATK